MSLNQINNKLGEKERKIKYTMYNLNLDTNSMIHCSFCHKKLGIIHMLGKSLFCKKGNKYLVVCKHCNKINTRVKGEIGEMIDKNWDDYGV